MIDSDLSFVVNVSAMNVTFFEYNFNRKNATLEEKITVQFSVCSVSCLQILSFFFENDFVHAHIGWM